MASQNVDLTTFVAAVWKDKFRVALTAIIFAALAFVYTWVIKPIWMSSTVLLIPAASNTVSLSTTLSGALGKGENTPLLTLQGIATSRRVLEPYARRLKLSMPDFLKIYTVTPNVDTGQLLVSIQHPNKPLALELCKGILSTIEEVDKDSNISLGAQKATAYQSAVEEKTRDLNHAYDQIATFEASTQTAPTPVPDTTQPTYQQRLKDVEFDLAKVVTQLKVAVASASGAASVGADLPTGIPDADKYRNQIVDLEAQLRIALQSQGERAPAVELLRRQIDVAKKVAAEQIGKYLTSVQKNVDPKVADLEGQRKVLEWQRSYLQKLAALAPTEMIQLQKLVQEAATRQEVLKNVRVAYEQAKLDASVEPRTWTVLVDPYVEDIPINKKFILNVILGFVLGAAIGMIRSMFRHRQTGQKTVVTA